MADELIKQLISLDIDLRKGSSKVDQFNLYGDENLIDYEALKKLTIPDIILNYYMKIEEFPFLNQVEFLKENLLKINFNSEGDKYFKNLFLGMIYFYLDDKKKCLYYLDQAKNNKIDVNLNKLINYLRANIVNLNRILIITSMSYERNNNFLKIKKLRKDITLIMSVKRFNVKKYFEYLDKYDQVFMIGHGKDDYIKIGGTPVTQDMFIEYMEKGNKLPEVLGLLSCENAIQDQKLLNNLNYYITDEVVSPQGQIEFFLYGYIKSFSKSKSILEAFRAAKIAVLFRTPFSPSFVIYTNGTKL